MTQKIILSIILFNLIAFTAFGQAKLKVGYADIDYIVGNMPETVNAQANLDEIMNKLQSTRDSLVTDYNIKIEEFKKNASVLVDDDKRKKEGELINIQRGIQGFEADIQTAVNIKKDELLKPIYTRIGKLITIVAKENGYTHIINNQIDGNSVILYAEENTDISDLVIAKAKL